jgi:hypothetical protein
MARKPLIDYKKLKEWVSIEQLCTEWGIELTGHSDSQLKSDCPLCEGSGFKVTPSFNSWKCFSCGEHGNILDLVAAIEECTIREASALIADHFDVSKECAITKAPKVNNEKKAKPKPQVKVAETGSGTVEEQGSITLTNTPLEWAFRSLDHEHELILDANIAPEILLQLKAGYCTTGSMKDRLALPYYDGEDRLIGYCGVDLVGDKEVPIIFPPPQYFNPSIELFGTSLAKYALAADQTRDYSTLYIVNHPLDALHLNSHLGILNVVATVNTTSEARMSPEHIDRVNTLVGSNDRVVFLLNKPDELVPADVVAMSFSTNVRVCLHPNGISIRSWQFDDFHTACF